MDRKAEEASEVPHKSAVILPDRAREIIRLFEERERKRHQVLNSLAATLFDKELPSRKAEIDAEREAAIARLKKLDPELAAKFRSEGKI
jgi:hypothetical protein